jgi:NADPH:quinone reductase-like Zn-dependent oxidoreductase
MQRILTGVTEHPGLASGTGKSSILPAVPGTKRKSFDVLLDQVQGKQFMEAYQDLKGGGVITEIEGEKATSALARMDAAQSEGDFLSAVADFKGVVERGIAEKRRRAGVPPQTGEAAPLAAAPSTKTINGVQYTRGEDGQWYQ